MRTIKFRAWDKGSQTMIYPDKKENEKTADYMLNAWCDSENERSILMQFTGLHDKNKKEIYEGDVVEWKTDIDEDYFGGKLGFVAELVKFQGGAFYPVCNMDEYEFEVIGNIYENSELLKL